MTSLYVDRRGVNLKADGEALLFYENDERVGTVPMAPLSRVFLRGDVTLTASLLGKLGEKNIGVVVLSGRKGEPTLLMGRPHNDAARRVAQYRLSLDGAYCLRFSRAIVEAKLRNQLALIVERRDEDLRWRYPLTRCQRQIEEMIGRVDAQPAIPSLRGLEGAAANVYFAALAESLPQSLGFRGRNRRPPRDPFNATLSLAYTLLHSEAVVALYGAGLDPFIGFYHGLDFGRESLACDLMEVLRPHADRFAIELFRKDTLKATDFSTSDGACFMGKAARASFYGAYENQADGFRRLLDQAIGDVVQAVGSSAAGPVTTQAAERAAP